MFSRVCVVSFGLTITIAMTSTASAQLDPFGIIAGLAQQQRQAQIQQRQAQAQAQLANQIAAQKVALTNCVAKAAVSDPDAARAYRDGVFDTYAAQLIPRCPEQIDELTEVYEALNGRGSARLFLDGAYAADLPRAVLKRVGATMKVRAAAVTREDTQKAAQETRARAMEAARQADEQMVERVRARDREQVEEAERKQALALSEQRAAEARAKADEASARARVAAESAEAERLKQVETAKGAARLLAAKAVQCGHDQLRSLVKSGENADTLASVVMTICGTEVDHFVSAALDEYRLEQSSSGSDEGIYRARLRAETREHVMALAVQAKAGVGEFAPASTSN